eukprot:1474039-Alexandrium_andersonii.AAC.1
MMGTSQPRRGEAGYRGPLYRPASASLVNSSPGLRVSFPIMTSPSAGPAAAPKDPTPAGHQPGGRRPSPEGGAAGEGRGGPWPHKWPAWRASPPT